MNPDTGSATASITRFRYVDISCLSRDGLQSPETIPEIAREDAPSRAQRLIKEGDSLVSTVRPERGARGRAPSVLDGHVASSGICVLRPKEIGDASYIYATIRSEEFTEWCVGRETGTSYPAVSSADIGNFPLLIPPADVRERIGATIDAVDAAIDARSSFEKLLLDYGLAVFDAALEAGEPRVLRVGDAADFSNSSRIPLSQMERDKRPGQYPYYGATGVFGSVDGYLFDGLYLLVGEDGSVMEDDGTPVLQIANGKFWVNNHAHVLSGKGIPTEALWFALRNLAVDPAVTGAVQPKLSKGRLSALELIYPGDATGFEAVATACISNVLSCRAERENLLALRTFLLPRLLSGELVVDAGADELEEVS